MACELTARKQPLALEAPARAWEPERMRLRLFSTAGRLVHGGRRTPLRLAATLALSCTHHHHDQPTASLAPANQPELAPAQLNAAVPASHIKTAEGRG
jgi:hypothetical protein